MTALPTLLTLSRLVAISSVYFIAGTQLHACCANSFLGLLTAIGIQRLCRTVCAHGDVKLIQLQKLSFEKQQEIYFSHLVKKADKYT